MYIVVLHIYEIPKEQPGDKYGRAGRLALVEDASGGEAYYYGRQGEVTKTVRTVMASVADIRTYVYGATYDSWNRVHTMTYPDGEVVTYHYNAAGQVESLTSSKQGKESTIVAQIGYDKDGHTVYQKLGNGTETTYSYDKQRERLQDMTLTGSGSTLMQNKYRYDAVDNILGITNAANPQGLTKLNMEKLGGASMHTYQYDELNRLIHATGKAKSTSYDMTMTFGLMSEPLTKVQKVDSTTTVKSYNFTYKYEDESHPTAPTQIGHDHYTYDANGNPTLVTNDSTNATREMYWDEDNRLMVLSDNGKTSRYTYNASGERIASRIGTGTFNNVYGVNGSYVTAGQQDYAERMNQIESQKEAYYKELGIAPGVPTEKGAYGDPENTGVGYNTIITNLGDHSVPEGWVQAPKHNGEQGSTPGTPISWNEPSTPDDPQAGYGYISNDTTMEETFFFHSDHLGSTSYITDDKGNITQYDAYLPYGELLVDEHSSSEDLPYKFNGKEFDEETGLYYYGARYMNPVASMWYGVDPLAEKYATTSGYVYTLNNPIKLGDSDGRKVKLTNNEEDLAAIRETLPHRLREYITANDGFIDKQKMEEGLKAMGDDVSLNYKSLFEIVADDRTMEFSLLDKPHAVNASGNTPKHMITFGPTLYFEADNIGNPAEWITQGGTSISLAPKSHKWTKWDNIQRARLAEDEVQFSPNENYQVQINSSMYKNDATHKNGAKAVAHELYGHILYMFRGWDSAHGSNRKVDNQKLENWLQRIGNETEYNFDH